MRRAPVNARTTTRARDARGAADRGATPHEPGRACASALVLTRARCRGGARSAATSTLATLTTRVSGRDGAVARTGSPSLAGGTSTTLATKQNYPPGIAVDSTSVYWANSGPGGGIMKLTPK